MTRHGWKRNANCARCIFILFAALIRKQSAQTVAKFNEIVSAERVSKKNRYDAHCALSTSVCGPLSASLLGPLSSPYLCPCLIFQLSASLSLCDSLCSLSSLSSLDFAQNRMIS